MSNDEMSDQITEVLQEGIRKTIEDRDADAFENAAKEAYKVRTAGRALSDDDAIPIVARMSEPVFPTVGRLHFFADFSP